MSAFPSSHTTTTTTTTAATASQDDRRLFINTGFLRSQYGMLKIAQIVLCLLAFICVMAAGSPWNQTSDANFISFVTVTGLLVTMLLLFLYFINAVVYFTIIPWVFVELCYTALWTFFAFVAGIVGSVAASKYGRGNAAYASSAFFLFIAMLVYGYTAFRLFLLHRKGVRLFIVTVETV